MSEELEKPQSIRLKSSQAKKIDRAASKMALAKQDVIRLALDFGLKQLEQANYQLTEIAADNLLVCLPERLAERIKNVEKITGLPIGAQVTTALTSLCLEVEKHGKVTFPLKSPVNKSA